MRPRTNTRRKRLRQRGGWPPWSTWKNTATYLTPKNNEYRQPKRTDKGSKLKFWFDHLGNPTKTKEQIIANYSNNTTEAPLLPKLPAPTTLIRKAAKKMEEQQQEMKQKYNEQTNIPIPSQRYEKKPWYSSIFGHRVYPTENKSRTLGIVDIISAKLPKDLLKKFNLPLHDSMKMDLDEKLERTFLGMAQMLKVRFPNEKNGKYREDILTEYRTTFSNSVKKPEIMAQIIEEIKKPLTDGWKFTIINKIHNIILEDIIRSSPELALPTSKPSNAPPPPTSTPAPLSNSNNEAFLPPPSTGERPPSPSISVNPINPNSNSDERNPLNPVGRRNLSLLATQITAPYVRRRASSITSQNIPNTDVPSPDTRFTGERGRGRGTSAFDSSAFDNSNNNNSNSNSNSRILQTSKASKSKAAFPPVPTSSTPIPGTPIDPHAHTVHTISSSAPSIASSSSSAAQPSKNGNPFGGIFPIGDERRGKTKLVATGSSSSSSAPAPPRSGIIIHPNGSVETNLAAFSSAKREVASSSSSAAPEVASSSSSAAPEVASSSSSAAPEGASSSSSAAEAVSTSSSTMGLIQRVYTEEEKAELDSFREHINERFTTIMEAYDAMATSDFQGGLKAFVRSSLCTSVSSFTLRGRVWKYNIPITAGEFLTNFINFIRKHLNDIIKAFGLPPIPVAAQGIMALTPTSLLVGQILQFDRETELELFGSGVLEMKIKDLITFINRINPRVCVNTSQINDDNSITNIAKRIDITLVSLLGSYTSISLIEYANHILQSPDGKYKSVSLPIGVIIYLKLFEPDNKHYSCVVNYKDNLVKAKSEIMKEVLKTKLDNRLRELLSPTKGGKSQTRSKHHNRRQRKSKKRSV